MLWSPKNNLSQNNVITVLLDIFSMFLPISVQNLKKAKIWHFIRFNVSNEKDNHARSIIVLEEWCDNIKIYCDNVTQVAQK